MTVHLGKCSCGKYFGVELADGEESEIICASCKKVLHIKYALEITEVPQSREICYDLPCNKCAILQGIIEGEKCPRCFYHEKSMLFLQMQEASN